MRPGFDEKLFSVSFVFSPTISFQDQERSESFGKYREWKLENEKVALSVRKKVMNAMNEE